MKLLIAILLALPLTSFAQGDHSGGGGDIVICNAPRGHHGLLSRIFKRRKLDYYLLDVYEAQKTAGRFLNLGGDELSIADKIELVRQNYAVLDPVRAERYATEALKIAEDLDAQEKDLPAPHGIAVALNQRLEDIDDAADTFKFLECKKEQLVRQEPPLLGKGAFYTFDKKWWRRLNKDNKVATIFHEVVYREFREYGADVSRPSRILNSFLFSLQSKELSLTNYLTFLANNRAREYFFPTNIGNVRIFNLEARKNIWSAQISDDGFLSEVAVEQSGLNPEAMPYSPLKLAPTHLVFDRNRTLIGLRGYFEISHDNVTNKITNPNADCYMESSPCTITSYITVESDGTFKTSGSLDAIHFDKNGNVLRN